MIKVKEFLDKEFISHYPSTAEIKKNGQYCVHGSWSYPTKEWNDDFYIGCLSNNETLVFQGIIRNGKGIGLYGYLQTYLHIPRGEPDNYGYYARSTDEEIIQYLKSYMLDRIREEKLSSIL